jgi:hypothetical protein
MGSGLLRRFRFGLRLACASIIRIFDKANHTQRPWANHRIFPFHNLVNLCTGIACFCHHTFCAEPQYVGT